MKYMDKGYCLTKKKVLEKELDKIKKLGKLIK
jgi:hypothetical protein